MAGLVGSKATTSHTSRLTNMEDYCQVEGSPERPGVPSVTMSRTPGLQMRRTQYKRRPRFGDKLPGRPTRTARIDIPKSQRKINRLYKQYHEMLPKLSRAEAMALCRAFKYSYSTHLMRKYQHRKPKLEEVILVVGWIKAGKPVKVNRRRLTVASLFFAGR